MECNKEEAIRAKEMAERKMLSKDFVGAQKIVLKAQQLYPGLENISQMLTVCEVHISAKLVVVGSEMDWYGILQVPQTADESSIKKQYRKLALVLHPDKNNFPGAEAAFKLIGEAHRMLSDQAKRSVYDIKRQTNVRTAGQRQPPPQSNMNSYAKKQPGIQKNFANQSTSQYPDMSQPHQQQTQIPPAFWTKCPFCNTMYQHYKTHLSRVLRCQNCSKPFVAYDMNVQGGPANSGYPWNQSSSQHKDIPSQGANHVGQQSTISKTTTSAEVDGSSRSKASEDGDAASRWAKFEEEKRMEMNRRAQTGKYSGNVGQKRKVAVESSNNCNNESTDAEDVATKKYDVATQNAKATSERYPRRSMRQKQNVTCNENGSGGDDLAKSPNSKWLKRGLSLDGADSQCNGTFSNGDANKIRKPAGGASVFEDKKQEQEGRTSSKETLPNGEEHAEKYKRNGEKEKESSPIKKKKMESFKVRDSSEVKSSVVGNPDNESNLDHSIVYPEPDFHDFDKDRMQTLFRVDQIWAVYDDADGMPRYYVRIRKIYSHGRKVRITWLEADPRDQYGLDWLEEKLPVACGSFRNWRTEDTEDLLMFSHLASWEKGEARGSYKIYPRTGDIWALFKGWNIDWSSNSDAHRKYEFEFVEVLCDYAEGTGVVVMWLVKLEGFTCLFEQMDNMEKNPVQIPAKELLRFSHRVPCYRMTGEEKKGVPPGSFELDPASVFTEGYSPSEGIDKVVNKSVDIESNTMCSKPWTEKEAPATGPMKLNTTQESTSPNKKNGHNRENFDERSCSKSGTEKETHVPGPKTLNAAKKSTSPNEKNIQNKGNLAYRRYSPRKMNPSHENLPGKAYASQHAADEEKPVHCGPGILDDKHDNKSGETISTKCETDGKEKNFDPGEAHPSDASDQNSPPDPVFHNFKSERLEDKFQPSQIWALYSTEDGCLPKYYVRINKVKLPKFKIYATCLEVSPESEKEIGWCKKELPVTCGTFKLRTSETKIFETAWIFSHRVRHKSTKDGYLILPKKGEVWAIYKNWSAEWTYTDLKNCEYEMVQVLENDGLAIEVSILEVVDGFKTVYEDAGVRMALPRDELLRFSHLVPSFQATKNIGRKLKDYLELDPAALPGSSFSKNPR